MLDPVFPAVQYQPGAIWKCTLSRPTPDTEKNGGVLL